jgi:hypothetical protein
MRERADPVRFPLRTWIKRTALYDLADRFQRRGERDPAPALTVDRALRDAPDAAANETLWTRAEARLESLRALLERDACRLVVLSTPMLEDVVERVPAARLARIERWARSHPDVIWIDPRADLQLAMERLLAEIAERRLTTEQVWRRDTRAPLSLTHTSESVFLRDDPWHLTARGHLALARSVDDALARAGLLR